VAAAIEPTVEDEAPANAPVVRRSNPPRTQNGHIRNDTGDVSQRILDAQKEGFPGETVQRMIARARA
jgi:hypothetical protein